MSQKRKGMQSDEEDRLIVLTDAVLAIIMMTIWF